jgi:hypothetical protein
VIISILASGSDDSDDSRSEAMSSDNSKSESGEGE